MTGEVVRNKRKVRRKRRNQTSNQPAEPETACRGQEGWEKCRQRARQIRRKEAEQRKAEERKRAELEETIQLELQRLEENRQHLFIGELRASASASSSLDSRSTKTHPSDVALEQERFHHLHRLKQRQGQKEPHIATKRQVNHHHHAVDCETAEDRIERIDLLKLVRIRHQRREDEQQRRKDAEALRREKQKQMQKASEDYANRVQELQRRNHKQKVKEQRKMREDEAEWKAECVRISRAARAARAAAAKRVRDKARLAQKARIAVGSDDEQQQQQQEEEQEHQQEHQEHESECHSTDCTKEQLAKVMDLAMVHLRQQAAPREGNHAHPEVVSMSIEALRASVPVMTVPPPREHRRRLYNL
jgi:colicin import membrane protein